MNTRGLAGKVNKAAHAVIRLLPVKPPQHVCVLDRVSIQEADRSAMEAASKNFTRSRTEGTLLCFLERGGYAVRRCSVGSVAIANKNAE